MNTSKSNNSSTNTMQIEIVPQRMLSVNTTKKLLNEIFNKFSLNALKIKENEIRTKHEYIRGNKDR